MTQQTWLTCQQKSTESVRPTQDGYHEWVFEAISEVVDKYKHDPELCRKMLIEKLKELGCQIQQDPDLLIQGGRKGKPKKKEK